MPPRALALAVILVGACTNREMVSREFGGPCLSSGNCTGICLPPAIWPNGFCTRTCRRDDDCPVGALCATGFCLYACFDDQDCSLLSEGWDCLTLDGKLVCRPDHLEIPDAGQ